MKKFNIINFIKTTKNNKKNKAILTLSIYFLFMISVILIYSPKKINEPNKTPLTPTINVLEKYKQLENYEFKYEIYYIKDEQTVQMDFIGYTLENISSFHNKEKEYLFENGNLYTIVNGEKSNVSNKNIKNVFSFTPSYVFDLLSASNLKTKEENYENKTIIKQYIHNIEKDSENIIEITTTENKQNIVEVEINFSDINDVELYKNLEKIKIKYFNN